MSTNSYGCLSRRHLLTRGAFGLGGFGLAWLLQRDGLLAAPEKPMLETPHYDLLPGFASIVDEVVLLRSMQTGVNNHGQSIYALQNGRHLGGRPTLGSWLGYALGSESQELPAYVALTDPRGLPVLGVDNWTNG